ncbi:MAG: RIP metalloprotease RseP [Bacteroidia bacterium]|nr:RIP metalloprotease RseP [Bacteroidia bacterium]NNC85352.1 RIP metalloprotease RseP [Bacteroidia bacterium]NNM16057.1 RIP metalloprotease RseP [Bacteroidia bacterium]
MDGLVMAGQLILALAILVTLHELGHYLAARAFGIRVEKFYLFFDAWGKKLFSFTKGDTEYGIGWLPLGGYVKISGMIDESMDKDAMKEEPKDYEFRSKPAWQRLIVMVAGVFMNVVLGIALFAFILLVYKKDYVPTSEVKGIYANQLGKEIGLQDGDKMLEIDGKPFERFNDVTSYKGYFANTLTVERSGERKTIEVPEDFYKNLKSKDAKARFISAGPLSYQIGQVVGGGNAEKAGFKSKDFLVAINNENLDGLRSLPEVFGDYKNKNVSVKVEREGKTLDLNTDVTDKGTIGIQYGSVPRLPSSIKKSKYNLGSAINYGAKDAVDALVVNAIGIGKIFQGKESASESVQGPIGIAVIFGPEWIWEKFWWLTAMLSMILAFMNILPIPALDGGHAMFLTLEAVSGRKFSDKFMERVQVFGMLILLTLMAFILGNDIWKHWIN